MTEIGNVDVPGPGIRIAVSANVNVGRDAKENAAKDWSISKRTTGVKSVSRRNPSMVRI